MDNVLNDCERLALMVGCLCHDLDHRGVNNQFLNRFVFIDKDWMYLMRSLNISEPPEIHFNGWMWIKFALQIFLELLIYFQVGKISFCCNFCNGAWNTVLFTMEHAEQCYSQWGSPNNIFHNGACRTMLFTMEFTEQYYSQWECRTMLFTMGFTKQYYSQ